MPRPHVLTFGSPGPSAALAAGSPRALGTVSVTVTAGARLGGGGTDQGWRRPCPPLRRPQSPGGVRSSSPWSAPAQTPSPLSSAAVPHPKDEKLLKVPNLDFLLLTSPHFLWAAWTRSPAPAPSNPLCGLPTPGWAALRAWALSQRRNSRASF